MQYVRIVMFVICFIAGVITGSKFFPRTELREVPITKTQTVTQTKVVEKFPSGKVVERTIVQTKDKAKVSTQPTKPEYRVGALMPIGSDRLPTVQASKRLFGDVWLDAQYSIKHKEVQIGISYEW